jgi:hypothetical protein
MKNRIREIASLVAVLFLFSGCSQDAPQSSLPAELSGAELTSTILDIYAVPDRFDRLEKIVSVLRGVQAGQGDALEAALDGLDFPNRELERVLIITAWSTFDPIAATKWVVTHERTEIIRVTMLSESVYQWALNDPEGMLRDAYMVAYARTGWDPTTLRTLIRGWYDSGEPNLEQFVYTLPRLGDDRQRGVSALIESKLEHEGVEAVIAWAKASIAGDVPYKQYIYSRLAGDIAKIDPARAIAWCDEICDTQLGEEIPLWIATVWVVDSGAEAMDWITARDADVISVRVGARAAYRRFLLHARDGAFAWMEATTEQQRLEQEALQGPLFMYINERSGLGAAEEAIEWTQYITDDATRDELLRRIAMRWLRLDPVAAEAWLAQSSLSEELKAQAHQSNKSKKPRPGKFHAMDTVLPQVGLDLY